MPENSSFFNELDAFPKRSTKVIDLWYKKKYPSYPKNEGDPFKVKCWIQETTKVRAAK